MTTLVKQNQIWNSMPGWGIVADLTPPELIAGRKLRFVRKVLALGLIVLALILTGAFVLARLQTNSANDALAAEQLRTTQLTAQQGKYTVVTQVKSSIDKTKQNVAQLMTTDIDTSATIGQIRAAVPAAMKLSGITVTVAKASGTAQSAAGNSLDTSGHKQVASVSLTGKGTRLVDLANYVDALKKIPGVIDVLPLSNQSGTGDVQFSVRLILTDQVFSHYFDVKAGSK